MPKPASITATPATAHGVSASTRRHARRSAARTGGPAAAVSSRETRASSCSSCAAVGVPRGGAAAATGLPSLPRTRTKPPSSHGAQPSGGWQGRGGGAPLAVASPLPPPAPTPPLPAPTPPLPAPAPLPPLARASNLATDASSAAPPPSQTNREDRRASRASRRSDGDDSGGGDGDGSSGVVSPSAPPSPPWEWRAARLGSTSQSAVVGTSSSAAVGRTSSATAESAPAAARCARVRGGVGSGSPGSLWGCWQARGSRCWHSFIGSIACCHWLLSGRGALLERLERPKHKLWHHQDGAFDMPGSGSRQSAASSSVASAVEE
eukprot:scaffold101485_cov45-Phaeocystis_antarctica.AAC.1